MNAPAGTSRIRGPVRGRCSAPHAVTEPSELGATLREEGLQLPVVEEALTAQVLAVVADLLHEVGAGREVRPTGVDTGAVELAVDVIGHDDPFCSRRGFA